MSRAVERESLALTFLHAVGHAVSHNRAFADVFLKQTRETSYINVKRPGKSPVVERWQYVTAENDEQW